MIKKLTRYILICLVLVMCIPFTCMAADVPSRFYFNKEELGDVAFDGVDLDQIYFNGALVWQRKPPCELELSELSATLVYPTTEYTFRIDKNTGGELSVSSSDESVATVTIDGNTVTITYVDEGEADITVSSAETEEFGLTKKTFHIKTEKGSNPLGISQESGTTCIDSNLEFSITKNVSGGAITLTSSVPEVTFTFDGTDAVISTTKITDATITITSAATRYYKETSITYEASFKDHSDFEVNGGEEGIHKKCDECDKILSTDHVIDKEGSQYKTQATCTQAGVYYLECECGYCPKDDTKTYNVAAFGHNPTAVVQANGECSGSSGYYRCTRCGANTGSFDNRQGHDFGGMHGCDSSDPYWVSKQDETCTTYRLCTFRCSKCGKTNTVKHAAPAGHDFKNGPRTVYDGYCGNNCARCGMSWNTAMVQNVYDGWDIVSHSNLSIMEDKGTYYRCPVCGTTVNK